MIKLFFVCFRQTICFVWAHHCQYFWHYGCEIHRLLVMQRLFCHHSFVIDSTMFSTPLIQLHIGMNCFTLKQLHSNPQNCRVDWMDGNKFQVITSVLSICTVLYYCMQLSLKCAGDKLLQQCRQNRYFVSSSYIVVAVLFYLKACGLRVPSSARVQKVGCQCIYCNACKSLDSLQN